MKTLPSQTSITGGNKWQIIHLPNIVSCSRTFYTWSITSVVCIISCAGRYQTCISRALNHPIPEGEGETLRALIWGGETGFARYVP